MILSRPRKSGGVAPPLRTILMLLSVMLFAHHQFLITVNLGINNDVHVKIMVDAFSMNHHEVVPPRYTISSLTSSTRQSPRQTTTRLNGVKEWRAKYSIHNSTQQQPQLPLLLLPFNPAQILLPGQTTSYTFRHGKYMDLIDESITRYESVIGMTILSDDGLLPITVLCEVIEEELDMHMGYRGFSSMEVGIRAVGRVRRCDVVENVGVNKNNNNNNSNSGGGGGSNDDDLRTNALDDIHQGKVVDWFDDPLDEEQMVIANEYRENILSILRLGQQVEEEEQQSSEMLRNQQRCYVSACEIIALDNNNSDKVDNDFTATSWGAFAAAATAINRPIGDGSINIDALSTADTVERLRLGLAVLLENHMPLWSNGDVVEGGSSGTIKRVRGKGGDVFSIHQDGIDAFQ